jgi:hypothetical protein
LAPLPCISPFLLSFAGVAHENRGNFGQNAVTDPIFAFILSEREKAFSRIEEDMRVKFNRRKVIILLLVLLALLVAVAAVAAADAAGSGSAVAATDLQGAEGIITNPISGTDLRWISPWGIDATRSPDFGSHFLT